MFILYIMANTRNRNTVENYKLEKEAYGQKREWITYEHSHLAYQSNLPGNGLGGAWIPRTELSSNSEDVESYLFGIGASNLVEGARNTEVQPKSMRSLEIADRLPLIMPDPMLIEGNQRPLFRS